MKTLFNFTIDSLEMGVLMQAISTELNRYQVLSDHETLNKHDQICYNVLKGVAQLLTGAGNLANADNLKREVESEIKATNAHKN